MDHTSKEKSKSIAAIVGPTLVVMIISEMKFWNPTLYDDQIAPVIYLNGLLFFVAGLAIVRNHNVWTKQWPVILTVIGYVTMVLGLFRMFLPNVQESEFENNNTIMAIQLILVVLGVFLTIKAYKSTKDSRRNNQES